MLAQHDPNLVLRTWQGGLAKVWSYTVSHSVLQIRVINERDTQKYLTILCGDVETIQGPMTWFNSDLETEKTSDGFVLRDRGAGFEVHAGAVGVREDSAD